MSETFTYSKCEVKYIEEGYDPPEAAELCADEGERRSDEDTGKPDQDKTWEYWFG